jgi:hypothetical protein
MTDEERRALASEILEEAIKFFSERAGEAFEEVGRRENGEPVTTYSGESDEGFGGFYYEYAPLDAIVMLIAECESYYDQSGATIKHKELQVRFMAEIAAKVMLVNIRQAIQRAMKENFRDGQLVASGVLADTLITVSQKLDGRLRELDSRELIKEEERRAGAVRREHLRDLLGRIPGSLTKAKSGRKRKVTLTDVRQTRDKLKSENRPASVSDISVEIDCDESTIYKTLKGKALEDL